MVNRRFSAVGRLAQYAKALLLDGRLGRSSRYPRKRTCGGRAAMSAKLPKADLTPLSLDHLVGPGEQRGWHREAEHAGGLKAEKFPSPHARSLGLAGGIVSAQASALIGAEKGFATAT